MREQQDGHGAAPESRGGKAGDPRENPPTNGIARHDSHVQESGVTRPGIQSGPLWWEASRLTAQPPVKRGMQRWGKRDVPEETHRPATLSGTIPSCENPEASPPGI
ncbi:hypothetical protein PR048_014301 [Dryococelus australis]|uniref:Uncharacterized protein n=1 Tax=Dryococelus australis TaxID=614101 RepID=A0ABQ9HE20_9NEOP|nr:hypothetical protein PR048_014301 [Dryococelus australis]